MNWTRIAAGLVLVLSMVVGCGVWASHGFTGGAVTFLVGAIIAGALHNRGDREAASQTR